MTCLPVPNANTAAKLTIAAIERFILPFLSPIFRAVSSFAVVHWFSCTTPYDPRSAETCGSVENTRTY
jgi:hypothetical protein